MPGYSTYETTDNNGIALFENLVENVYDVTVLNQTKSVDIPFFDTLTFTFTSLPDEPMNPFLEFLRANWLPLLILIGIVAAVGIAIFVKKRW